MLLSRPKFKNTTYSYYAVLNSVCQRHFSNVVEIKKENVGQSPWRMNFLVKLVRGVWVPDALAQMKFSPKHKAAEISKMIKRASTLAQIRHNAIPEELIVKEIMVTKGRSEKRMRIMGRGRTGFGYIRWSHVRMKVEQINFDELIAKAKGPNEKWTWIKRKEIAAKAKESVSVSQL